MNRFKMLVNGYRYQNAEEGAEASTGVPAQEASATDNQEQQPSNSGKWYDSLPEDIRSDQNITKFDSIEGLAKSHINAQRLIGVDKIPMPQTEDDWNGVYDRLGRPETADSYQINAPEGVEIDATMQTEFKNVAHQLGLSQKQAEGLAAWQISQSSSMAQSQNQQSQLALESANNSLKSEWGSAYEQNINFAARAASEFMGESGEQFFNNTMIDGVPAGEHPVLIKMFHEVARGMMESDKLEGIANEGKMTPAEIEEKRSSLMSHPAYMDRRHPEHASIKKKVNQLFGN